MKMWQKEMYFPKFTMKSYQWGNLKLITRIITTRKGVKCGFRLFSRYSGLRIWHRRLSQVCLVPGVSYFSIVFRSFPTNRREIYWNFFCEFSRAQITNMTLVTVPGIPGAQGDIYQRLLLNKLIGNNQWCKMTRLFSICHVMVIFGRPWTVFGPIGPISYFSMWNDRSHDNLVTKTRP